MGAKDKALKAARRGLMDFVPEGVSEATSAGLMGLQEALARARSNLQDVGVDFIMRGSEYFGAPRAERRGR